MAPANIAVILVCLVFYTQVLIKCLQGIQHQSRGECHRVCGYALTFMHQKYQCTGSQGPPSLGYGPVITVVWLLWDGKASAGGFLPMAVARDVMSYASYRIPSR